MFWTVMVSPLEGLVPSRHRARPVCDSPVRDVAQITRYTNPSASMASATRMNPAMLAPAM
jgi:hypothetical protein